MRPLRRTRICVAVSGALCASAPAHAQITTDGTLGAAKVLQGPNYSITADLGRQAGANLFHSFGQFSVPTAGSATFSGPASVSNIISRVTGGQVSSIDGVLRSTITGANLFLINPRGILFGPNASLDLTGSFSASTAHYLKLADGTRFDATPTVNPILSAAPPAAFGFLGPSGSIAVQGSHLQAAEGKSINLVGGPIAVSDASIKTVAGDIRLVGVGGAGEVSIAGEVTAGATLAPISIQRSELSTESSGEMAPGRILIRGGQLTVSESSITSTNNEQVDAPRVELSATGDLTVSASNITSQTGWSGRGADTSLSGENVTIEHNSQVGMITWGTGRGGDLSVTARNAARVVAAQADPDYTNVFSSALGSGDGGDIRLTGDRVTVQSGNLYSYTGDSGAGGSITVHGRDVGVTDGAWVYTYNNSGTPGRTGTIDLGATQRILIGGRDWFGNQAFVFTEALGGGRAGNVRLAAPAIDVIGGKIQSLTFGSGDTGAVNLAGDSVRILGGNGGLAMVDTTVAADGTGNGGNVIISASGSVEVSRADFPQDWTRVSTSTFGAGRGGDVTVASPTITVRDAASIWTGAFAGGRGGDIRLRGEDLSVVAGGKIESVAQAGGRGGDIDIAASGRLFASEEIPVRPNDQWNHGIYSLTVGTGDAGSIRIAAPEITLLGAFVQSVTYGAGNAGSIRFDGNVVRFVAGNNNIVFVESGSSNLTSGNGGDVEIRARTRFELNGSAFPQDWTRIAATTQGAGRGGQIVIESPDILIDKASVFSRTRFGIGDQGGITLRGDGIRLRNGGEISSVTEGNRKGSFILIEAQSLEASDYSTIHASTAGNGDAGQVTINAQRVRLTGASSIEASSTGGSGNAGDIVLNLGESLEIIERQPVETRFLFSPPGIAWPGGLLTLASENANAGRIVVTASRVMLDDGRILSTALGSGRGGRIEIRAGDLLMLNGAQIDARSAERSSGDAGSIEIVLSGRLEISGRSAIDGGFSGLYAQSQGSGHGGNVTLSASRVDVLGGGRIEAKSTGTGNAGSISIAASDALRIFGGSTISSEALRADGGNIDIRVGNLVHLRNSEITTAVGSGAGAGGNIFIDPTFVILENSRIAANAFGGPGGNIQIFATYFLNTLDSLVDASSAAGVPGTVQISAPNTNLSTQIKVLPATFFDATQLVREACSARGVAGGSASSLVGVGRGGLAASPERFATSTYFGDAPAAVSGSSDTTGLKLVTAKRARLGADCAS